jgi:hypothetical protein
VAQSRIFEYETLKDWARDYEPGECVMSQIKIKSVACGAAACTCKLGRGTRMGQEHKHMRGMRDVTSINNAEVQRHR